MPYKRKKISELTLADTLTGLYTIGCKIVNGTQTSVKVALGTIQTAYENMLSATTKANTATTNANTAADNANNKAALANTAANTANTAADNANAKATLADSKAALANYAASLANEKAALANTAASNANTAADNANAKATLADSKAALANYAASNAVSAASLANEKAALANTAASNANTAASRATDATIGMDGMIAEGKEQIEAMKAAELSLMRQALMSPTRMELRYVRRITLGNTVPQRIAASLFPAFLLQNVIFQQAFYSGDALYVDPHGNLTARKTGTATIHVIPAQNTSLAQTIVIEVTAPVIRKAGSVMRLLSGNRIRKV